MFVKTNFEEMIQRNEDGKSTHKNFLQSIDSLSSISRRERNRGKAKKTCL